MKNKDENQKGKCLSVVSLLASWTIFFSISWTHIQYLLAWGHVIQRPREQKIKAKQALIMMRETPIDALPYFAVRNFWDGPCWQKSVWRN